MHHCYTFNINTERKFYRRRKTKEGNTFVVVVVYNCSQNTEHPRLERVRRKTFLKTHEANLILGILVHHAWYFDIDVYLKFDVFPRIIYRGRYTR